MSIYSKELTELAYAIVEAYRIKETQGEAIGYVKDNNPEADLHILWAMWSAIDAYKDINN